MYAAPPEAEAARRGPAPQVCDGELYALIADDLACSPFASEGHCKVWGRLRICGLRVARRRGLRPMREHGLLSPRRVRQDRGTSYDGRITSEAPDLMWGTDGTRVPTAEEGMCWVFTDTVDHFNWDVVGSHVCKRGDRFAALQPVAHGLAKHFGGITTDAGRGLTLRIAYYHVPANHALLRAPVAVICPIELKMRAARGSRETHRALCGRVGGRGSEGRRAEERRAQISRAARLPRTTDDVALSPAESRSPRNA